MGATTFDSMSSWNSLEVKPKLGRVLMFQHRFLLHSGEELKAGLKYAMRTDLMLTKAATDVWHVGLSSVFDMQLWKEVTECEDQ